MMEDKISGASKCHQLHDWEVSIPNKSGVIVQGTHIMQANGYILVWLDHHPIEGEEGEIDFHHDQLVGVFAPDCSIFRAGPIMM